MTFRFGVVAATARTGAEWVSLARRAEDLGYDSLLVPDTVRTLSPFAALAAAAASTSRLRLGTYVLSAPNRAPGLVAWETRTLQLLSDGRLSWASGAGGQARNGTRRCSGRSSARRVSGCGGWRRRSGLCGRVRSARRSWVAASKPGMLRLAAEEADVVALGLPPQSSEEELAAMVGRLRAFGGSPQVRINVAAVAETADAVPDWVGRMVGGDPRQVAAAGGIGFLLGSPDEIAAILRQRKAELGISYIGVSSMFMEHFAPVINRTRLGTAGQGHPR